MMNDFLRTLSLHTRQQRLRRPDLLDSRLEAMRPYPQSSNRVRANGLFGIEYAARFRGRVEKNTVKPVLLRARRDQDPDVSARDVDAIEAVNQLMGWNIAGASKQKALEQRFESWRENRSSPADVSGDDKPQKRGLFLPRPSAGSGLPCSRIQR